MNDKEKQIEICENCKIKDTCSNRILVHMEKCKVNDCDYYCESTDREKQIEEMAKILKGYCCLIGGKPTKGDCYQCKQANASCFDYAKLIYNAGYRNVKDKVVLTEREHEIAMKNQYDVGFRFGCKKMQEELAKASELKAETIRLAKQETAREIFAKAKDLCKELENKYSHLCKSKKECMQETCRYEGVLAVKRGIYELAKEYGVEVE